MINHGILNRSGEDHKGCQANRALEEQMAKRVVSYVDAYWIPLAGEKDIYLHYSADISPYAAEHIFPAKESAGAHGCSSCS
jgi:hypothetical protein